MVGQSVPVTGIARGVAEIFGVDEGEDIKVAEGVAVGAAVTKGTRVGVGDGVATVHKVISVVQDAPREGQQYCLGPH